MEREPDRLTYTVEEAARLLRIGRTTAYALAKEWRMTNGRSGLPVLELGRVLRVPRRALEGMLDLGTDAATSSRPRAPAEPQALRARSGIGSGGERSGIPGRWLQR